MKVWVKKHSFLVALVLFLLLMLLTRFQSIDLPTKLQDSITLSLGVLYEAFPFVVLGILLSTAVQQFVPQSALTTFLPKNKLRRRATLSLTGSVLPVCECGNVPLARGLMIKGVSPQDALTFVLAAPIINPVTALTTWHAFSSTPQVLYIRLTAAFLIANFIGWVFEKIPRDEIITEDFSALCTHKQHAAAKNSSHKFIATIQKFSTSFRQEFAALLPALAGGSLLAGVLQTVIPRSWLLHIANEPVIAILTMILLAFIVSICANVDAFFALSLSGIFPLSAIVAFLVFGPMIDLKMLALLQTTFRTKILVQLSLLVFLLSTAVGLAAHYVI